MSPGRRAGMLAVLTALAVPAPGMPVEGGALYKARACDSCHGENGSHPVTPDYPMLAGQNARYLLRQMQDIRDGRRANGLSAAMRAKVAEVPDEELAVIAEWLSRQY